MSEDGGKSHLQDRRWRRRQTPSRGDQREEAILDAAQLLLDEHRFSELTVAAVAAAAGISRPALYFYFGSMEELLVALVTRGLTEVIETLESIDIPPDATPVDVLAIGVERTAAVWRSHGALLKTAAEHAYRVPAVGAQGRMLLDRGVDLYMALMAWSADLANRPPPDEADARRYAELCMRMVGNAFEELHQSPHDTADEQRLQGDLLTLISLALELEIP